MIAVDPLADRVRALVAEALEVPERQLDEGLTRAQAPTWDSLTHLRLVGLLEEELGVRFPMSQVAELDSVAAIVDAVRRAQ